MIEMDWDYAAESPASMRDIEETLLKGPTQKAHDEQLQLVRLLQALVPHRILRFPLRVKHTHDRRPDFQLLIGDKHVSIEASKIVSINYEHAAALQRQGLQEVLMRAEFMRPGQPKLPRSEMIQTGFVIGQQVYPPSLSEIDRAWLEHFKKSVLRKSEILSESDFQHGDEDWLMLWDRFGTKDWQMENRLAEVTAWLAPFWRRDHCFRRIFILAEDFSWVVSLTLGRGGLLADIPEP